MANAPILLFTFNRLWHTQQTIDALSKNLLANESNLIVFSDGPRNEADKPAVGQVRNLLRTITGFQSVSIVESDVNKGLARSIIDGVTSTLKQADRVIVVEDDLVTSPYFLSFMNQALSMYADDDRVASIHGYSYPVQAKLPDSFFIRGADCWGWATWRRAWKVFDEDGSKLLAELKDQNLTEVFDFKGSYPYTKMLEDQIHGRNNSWAIRWNASAFLRNMLTLYPGTSLVTNIGFDASGTHSNAGDSPYNSVINVSPVELKRITIEEHTVAREQIAMFFRKLNDRSIWSRMRNFIQRIGKT